MGCCQNALPHFFSVISHDSLIKCLSFLDPIDFTHFSLTCKDLNNTTNSRANSIQQYWRRQCIFICGDVLDAINCNNFNTKNWADFYVELQELIVYLIRNVHNQDLIQMNAFDAYVRQRYGYRLYKSKVYYLYAYNYSLNSLNGKKLFPMKLINWNSDNYRDQRYDNSFNFAFKTF